MRCICMEGAGMTDRDKVIKGLECCAVGCCLPIRYSGGKE